MSRILVLGAGLAGLCTAGLLARDGHDVTVLERDPAPPPADPWADWDRRGVNQFRQPHFLQPLWWTLIRAEFPEAVTALRAAGALLTNAVTVLPESRRGPVRAGDERFDTMTGRRPMIEAALVEAALDAGVEIRRGVAVSGFLADGPAATGSAGPSVTGVRAGAESIRADLVVDCTGRRSPVVAWLSAIGAAAPAEERADCGVVYYGRHFRGAEMPPQSTSYTQHHPSVTLLTLPTDHVTWSVAIATSSRDHALRALRSPAAWHAVAALYPTVAPWAAGEPVGDVFVMAGIEDRHRCLVVDEVPVATGVVLVGDSWAATNPSVGRGAAMALLHARALRDTLRKADLPDVPAAFHAATMESVEPIYRATTWHDTHRLAEMDADIAGVPYAPDDPRWTMSCALYAAAPKDPDLTRAYAAVGGMLTTPSEVFASPGVAERVLALAGPRYPDSPSRADLLAAVGG